MSIVTLSATPDIIDALIIAAQMQGIWDKLGEQAIVYNLHGKRNIYRLTGMSHTEAYAWNELVQLSFKFKMVRIGRNVNYDF
jgi:hypothetical protein